MVIDVATQYKLNFSWCALKAIASPSSLILIIYTTLQMSPLSLGSSQPTAVFSQLFLLYDERSSSKTREL